MTVRVAKPKPGIKNLSLDEKRDLVNFFMVLAEWYIENTKNHANK